MLYKRGKGAALSAAVDRNITQPYIVQPTRRVQEAINRNVIQPVQDNVIQPVQDTLTAVGDHVDREFIEPHDSQQIARDYIYLTHAELNRLINQLRDIDQFAFFEIQNTWNLAETTAIRRAAQNPRNYPYNIVWAYREIQRRIDQVRQRISSLTTPRRLNFGGKLTKRQKTAIGTTAALAGLAGMAAASASYNKPPPALRARAQDPPDIAAAKRESMARAERNSKRMQQLHEAQQRSWEKSLYPNNRFYDAETW